MPGHDAGIGGALHVVLTAQGVQTGCPPADVTGEQRQVDQAEGVVGAVGAFRNPQRPVDGSVFGVPVKPRGIDDQVAVNAGDLSRRIPG